MMETWCDIRRSALRVLPVIALCAVLLAGCRAGEDPAEVSDPNAEVAGKVYNAGSFQVLVPDGWAAFPIPDVFAEERNAVKPGCVLIIKGGSSERDRTAKPYLYLEQQEPDMQTAPPDPEFYKNIVNLGPLLLGAYTWSGHRCEDLHGNKRGVVGKMAILSTVSESVRYEAVIRLAFNGRKETISLEDRDVQAILASVHPAE